MLNMISVVACIITVIYHNFRYFVTIFSYLSFARLDHDRCGRVVHISRVNIEDNIVRFFLYCTKTEFT